MPDGQPEIISGSKKLMVGRSIYDYWLRQWYGVDPTNGDGLFLLDPNLVSAPIAGQDKQIDGVWVTNRAARAKYDFADSAIPDVYGSVNNEFRYKNFTLSALVTYQIGGKINDSNYSLIMTGIPKVELYIQTHLIVGKIQVILQMCQDLIVLYLPSMMLLLQGGFLMVHL
jgi:hypothetical protein